MARERLEAEGCWYVDGEGWEVEGAGRGAGLGVAISRAPPRASRESWLRWRGYCLRCKCVAPTCMDYVGRHVPHNFVRMCLCNTLRRAHRPCRSEVGRH